MFLLRYQQISLLGKPHRVASKALICQNRSTILQHKVHTSHEKTRLLVPLPWSVVETCALVLTIVGFFSLRIWGVGGNGRNQGRWSRKARREHRGGEAR